MNVSLHQADRVMQTSFLVLATHCDRNSLRAHQTFDQVVSRVGHLAHYQLCLSFQLIELTQVASVCYTSFTKLITVTTINRVILIILPPVKCVAQVWFACMKFTLHLLEIVVHQFPNFYEHPPPIKHLRQNVAVFGLVLKSCYWPGQKLLLTRLCPFDNFTDLCLSVRLVCQEQFHRTKPDLFLKNFLDDRSL